MKWEMGVFTAGSRFSGGGESNWSVEENKRFENALAVYDKETPDRWQKVAAMIPGKTIGDVMKQYKKLEDDVINIEAGLVSVPEYSINTTSASTTTTPFTLDYWVNSSPGFDVSRGGGGIHGGKKSSPSSSSSSGRPNSEHERKKGVPWTEEEHKLFLLGLKKHGKGDWRNISRNFVLTRTPTQVASHAQKYFIRQLSGGKDKRRASIHDITTVNLTDPINPNPNPNPNPTPSSPSQTLLLNPQKQASGVSTSSPQFHHQWSHQQQQQDYDGMAMAMAALSDIPSSYGGDIDDYNNNNSESSCYGFRILQGQSEFLHRSALLHQAQNIVFHMP